MKFIQRFGRLVGNTFYFLGIVSQIMCWLAGYTPLQASYCIILFFTIAIILHGSSLTATKIMREEQKESEGAK